MKKAKVVIVDDEPKVGDALKELLRISCPELSICGIANSAQSGYELIQSSKPDLVFLDIEMPEASGFQMLEMFESIEFKTIFVTAYDDYAIKAIKFSALDYILKPVHTDELIQAVNKYWKNQTSDKGLKQLLNNLRHTGGFQRIAIHSVGKIQYLDVNEIVHCEADGSYTNIHLKNGKSIMASKPLTEYEMLLEDVGFFRINRSHVVKLLEVTSYEKGEMDAVHLSIGTEIKFSRKRRSAFLEAMEKQNNL